MISEGLVAVVKHGGAFLVSSGVSTMVGYAAKSSVPKVAPHLIRHIPVAAKSWHLFQKVAIPAGAAALAGMASEQAVKYSDRKIDETVKDINKLQADMEKFVEKKQASKTEAPETD
jgi:outer membrane murein-binding lipoprotein Lpp